MMMPQLKSIVGALLVLSLIVAGGAKELHKLRSKPAYTGEEREEQYVKRGHTFPIQEYVPNTEGWARLMKQRFRQLESLEDTQQKWDGFIQTMSAALTTPNFTEYGWGLTHAPEDLTEELREAIYKGLPKARLEQRVDVIDAALQPMFIDRPDLTRKAQKVLHPILEAWSGMDLIPSIAYGFRVYRNESRLWMHVDRTQTHVISCIYHIASSDDSEPWPIVIEGYDGTTNSVVLKPGDILLYESAKNFHGRPSQFNGSWYTSLFVHFRPEGEWNDHNHDLDGHYAVPPSWQEVPDSLDPYPALEMVGTSMLEPECPDYWCHLQDAARFEGPGVYGEVLTGGGKRYSLSGDEEEL